MNDIFSESNIIEISNQIERQFPYLYRQYGPNLVAFIKAYFEWMEQSNLPIGEARSFYESYDIDTALNKFLVHFRNTYMYGIPQDVLGNQRLLQKHILELYRSKGSPQAIRLLFRLLYNEDIDFYIPFVS